MTIRRPPLPKNPALRQHAKQSWQAHHTTLTSGNAGHLRVRDPAGRPHNA